MGPDDSRMLSEGFPFIVEGHGGWTCVRLPCLVSSFVVVCRGRVVVILCLWEKLQEALFLEVSSVT